jgi:hypothetical protein
MPRHLGFVAAAAYRRPSRLRSEGLITMTAPSPELTVTVAVSFTYAGLAIEGKTFTMTTPLPGLTNAQGADTALTAEIAQYITDKANQLAAAIAASGDSDAAVQQISDDMLADAATLKADDPATPPAS